MAFSSLAQPLRLVNLRQAFQRQRKATDMEEILIQVETMAPILVGVLAAAMLVVFLTITGRIHCRELGCSIPVETQRTSLFFWHFDRF